MIFVPTNFWLYPGVFGINTPALTNLCDQQLTGYNFVSFRSVGDQPGRSTGNTGRGQAVVQVSRQVGGQPKGDDREEQTH